MAGYANPVVSPPDGSRQFRPLLFAAWLFATLATFTLLAQLGEIDTRLKSATAPLGILSFQFAGSADRAGVMIDAWRAVAALDSVRQSLKLDFAFLLIYPLSLALGCRLLADYVVAGLATVGRRLAYAVLVCAPLDASENLAQLRMLDDGASEAMARLAFVCATLKFALVIAAIGWLLAALVRILVRRIGAAISRP